jgi:carboxyl-terminal processing protease
MRFALFGLVLLVLPVLTAAQEPSSLEVTLKRAREHAYYAARVHWDAVEVQARSLASEQGEEPAIRLVLKALGDRHSFYLPPRKPVTTAVAGEPSGMQPPVRVLSQPQPPVAGVPVLQINGWSGTHPQNMAATAAVRSDLVNALSTPGCGIVLDFSGNTGGNMWPMLVGLSPLLTEGTLGGFKTAQGAVTGIEKKEGAIHIGGSRHVLDTATTRQPRYPARRIAIALGPRSASSGEIVPLMFHGQENVRFFGQRTSGRSTANTLYSLPNGGTAAITTAVTLNRHGREFDSHIEPDVLTGHPVEQAAEWIAGECRRR